MNIGGNITEAQVRQAIPLTELTEIIATAIREIRKSNPTYFVLKERLQEMELLSKNFDTYSNQPMQILYVYKQIQRLSLEFRNILRNKFNMEVSQYDKIGYAFYYENRRYNFDTLELDWLSVKNGELSINLEKAVDSVKDNAENSIKSEIQDIFANHYGKFFEAIKNTYNGKIGYRGKINQGHTTEGFEEHLSEHHLLSYKFLNEIYSSQETGLNNIEKNLLAIEEIKKEGPSMWSSHEELGRAWQHVINSLGTQRGTVAGDVGRYQVKRGTKSNKVLRLTSFANLRAGLQRYSAILSDQNEYEVARKIAIYLTEPLTKRGANIINDIKDKKVAELVKENIIDYTPGVRFVN